MHTHAQVHDNRRSLVGQCDGADKILQASLHRTVTALHLTVEKAAAKGTGGEEVLRVVTRARSAMDDAANKKEVSDENWTAVKQVMADILPSWDSGIPGSVQKGVEKLLVRHMLADHSGQAYTISDSLLKGTVRIPAEEGDGARLDATSDKSMERGGRA